MLFHVRKMDEKYLENSSECPKWEKRVKYISKGKKYEVKWKEKKRVKYRSLNENYSSRNEPSHKHLAFENIKEWTNREKKSQTYQG